MSEGVAVKRCGKGHDLTPIGAVKIGHDGKPRCAQCGRDRAARYAEARRLGKTPRCRNGHSILEPGSMFEYTTASGSKSMACRQCKALSDARARERRATREATGKAYEVERQPTPAETELILSLLRRAEDEPWWVAIKTRALAESIREHGMPKP